MIQRQHNVSEPVPPFYVKTLISLESSLTNALAKEKEAKKKMNATNAKALTAMKQKVKKAAKEYEVDVAKYQAVSPFLHFYGPTSEPRIQDPEAFERDYAAITNRDAVPAPGIARPSGPRAADDETVDDFTTVGKGGKVMQLTVEGIFKSLQSVQEARGKKVRTACQFLSPSSITSSPEHRPCRANQNS